MEETKLRVLLENGLITQEQFNEKMNITQVEEQLSTLSIGNSQNEESEEYEMTPDTSEEETTDIAPSFAEILNQKITRNSYASYIYKVLKLVHPEIGISNKAMKIMDSTIADIFERIATEAG